MSCRCTSWLSRYESAETPAGRPVVQSLHLGFPYEAVRGPVSIVIMPRQRGLRKPRTQARAASGNSAGPSRGLRTTAETMLPQESTPPSSEGTHVFHTSMSGV